MIYLVGQVTKGNASDEMLKSPSIIVSEKPYKAPFARASSLEDPCTSNLEYSKAPAISSELDIITETVKAQISESTNINSPELIHGSLEKLRGKESSKGFRRLLKFGRKNHSSAVGEHKMDSDKFSIDDSAIEDHAGTDGSLNEGRIPIIRLFCSFFPFITRFKRLLSTWKTCRVIIDKKKLLST